MAAIQQRRKLVFNAGVDWVHASEVGQMVFGILEEQLAGALEDLLLQVAGGLAIELAAELGELVVQEPDRAKKAESLRPFWRRLRAARAHVQAVAIDT